MTERLEIVNLSELDPAWNWLAHRFDTRADMHWRHVSTQAMAVPPWLPRGRTLRRAAAAWATRALLLAGRSILVSHGPRMSAYGAAANRGRSGHRPHLAYSFNFTTLPSGVGRLAMERALRSVDRFTVFSRMERRLYANHFQIDPERIDMLHWAVSPPQVDTTRPPLIGGDYVCAIGSQARDYRVLFDAMARLPQIRLVVVATADSVTGLAVPSNVELRTSIPLAQVHDILAHSRLMVLPLTGADVPCGHVTLVAAMHFGKAIVATRSEGIVDYLREGDNGRMVGPGDAVDLARTIEALYGAPDECRRLGDDGATFARRHCVEERVVEYFDRTMTQLRH